MNIVRACYNIVTIISITYVKLQLIKSIIYKFLRSFQYSPPDLDRGGECVKNTPLALCVRARGVWSFFKTIKRFNQHQSFAPCHLAKLPPFVLLAHQEKSPP